MGNIAQNFYTKPLSMRKGISWLLFISLLSIIGACSTSKNDNLTKQKPNIIIVYVDDLGYGDVGCYGAIGVETPNIDKLAATGVKFTDAHCPASTCTPSRYSLLTGEFAFRSNAFILPGNAPLIIDPKKPTLPGMLKKAGYKTGVVGKWHLGLGNGNVNWNDSIKPGPLEVGFDYCFLIPSTGDRVPTAYVENYTMVGLDPSDPIEVNYRKKIGNEPTGRENPELLRIKADNQHASTIVNGVGRIGFQSGGKSAWWIDEEFPDVLTTKAKKFISDNKNNPFFLFFSFHDIHEPRLPHPRFKGASTMGPRGDAIAQMDWCTGEIMNYLKELKIDSNTLIIFSSDNGPVVCDGYIDESVDLLGDHKPAGPFRGGKYSIFEAGTRVPTIVNWPAQVEHGESGALLTQVDLYASLASLVGQDPEKVPDSKNTLKAWLGKTKTGREAILEEGFALGYRMGQWKFIMGSEPRAQWVEKYKKIESGVSEEDKLYNLANDIGEQENVAEKYPEIVTEIKARLDSITGK